MNRSLISLKIKRIMNEKGISNIEVVKIIRENSTEKLARVCKIDLKRIEEIGEGSPVTLLEASIIMQAIGEDIKRLFRVDALYS